MKIKKKMIKLGILLPLNRNKSMKMMVKMKNKLDLVWSKMMRKMQMKVGRLFQNLGGKVSKKRLKMNWKKKKLKKQIKSIQIWLFWSKHPKLWLQIIANYPREFVESFILILLFLSFWSRSRPFVKVRKNSFRRLSCWIGAHHTK